MRTCDCYSSFYLTGKPEYLGLLYEFKGDSKLKTFMTTTTGLGKTTYPLIEILEVIKNTIEKQEMYLRENPPVVICKHPLDIVLGVKSFHVTEILMIISSQIIKLKNQPTYLVHNRIHCSRTLNALKIRNHTWSRDSSRHRVKASFLEILKSVRKDLTIQSTLNINLLLDILAQYMSKNKSTIRIDPTNPNMFHIQEDPLSTILGVNAFHKCQTSFLINKQLLIDASTQTTQEATNGFTNKKSTQCVSSTESLTNIDSQDESGNETMGIVKAKKMKCSRCQSEDTFGMSNCQKCWKENKEIRNIKKLEGNMKGRYEIDLRDDEKNLCNLCQNRKIDAIFMHGSTGHENACYRCAKRTWRHGNCPICKKQINNIIRIIPNH